MTYQQTIDYLFSRLPMFSRIGAAAFKPDLTNTVKLCNSLGNPHEKFKSVHVAGTNGKGSLSHMLAAILQTAGYKTGLYTSPHLKDFRERIRVNGEMIDEEFVIRFTEKIKPQIAAIAPSFFEITVAMAFEYFAQQKVDIAVIETGLGGRLDSTNIIIPEISVITNIGRDHMKMLGNTLEKIAFEKAGIIKQRIPVVIGEVIPETEPIFEQLARERHAPLSVASRKRFINDWHLQKNELYVEVAEAHKVDHKVYTLDLPGIYQAKNLLTVLEACSVLKEKNWDISEAAIQKALKQVRKLTGLHGRWEIMHTSPLLVLDVAHNADGIRQLVRQLEITAHNRLHIVFGMVKDKETDDILSLLPKTAQYYFTRAQIPRAMSENVLNAKARKAGLDGSAYPEVNQALQAAFRAAHADDMILVCGSVFVVGEVNIPVHAAGPAHTSNR